ncbi:hypothetical protein C8Q76DRAFT_91938 [Earliella scabrosa]|nr:hypothetical protein C8Q76DRAFT_91938 [Earliella scabrosa]
MPGPQEALHHAACSCTSATEETERPAWCLPHMAHAHISAARGTHRHARTSDRVRSPRCLRPGSLSPSSIARHPRSNLQLSAVAMRGIQTVRRRRRRGPRAMAAVSVCLRRAIWWLRGTYNAVTTSRPHSSASATHCTDGTSGSRAGEAAWRLRPIIGDNTTPAEARFRASVRSPPRRPRPNGGSFCHRLAVSSRERSQKGKACADARHCLERCSNVWTQNRALVCSLRAMAASISGRYFRRVWQL